MIVSYEISNPELRMKKQAVQSSEGGASSATTAEGEEYYHGIFQCDIQYKVF